MEFPSTGVQCSIKECKQLDFLPFTCNHCSNVFCKDHFHVTLHSCSNLVENFASGTEKTATFSCSQEQCTNKSPVAMPCVKCEKHFCLSHRYHGCLEESQEEQLNKLEKWKKPQKEFVEAKNVIDKNITNKLKKSKNQTMANKVQLMRLKSKSLGPNHVPTVDRRYFLIHPPITGQTNIRASQGAFVSVSWSVGRVIDSIADSLNIPNSNNVANAKKLRIFHYHNGNIVTDQMDVILSELLETNNLVDGQDIILEYSDSHTIDCSLYE